MRPCGSSWQKQKPLTREKCGGVKNRNYGLSAKYLDFLWQDSVNTLVVSDASAETVAKLWEEMSVPLVLKMPEQTLMMHRSRVRVNYTPRLR